MNRKPAHLIRRVAAAVALATAFCAAALGAASAASAETAWRSYTDWGPTNLAPGTTGGVFVDVYNVGDSTSVGGITVTVELPPGVQRVADSPTYAPCAGTTTVTCTPFPLPVNPGARSPQAVSFEIEVLPGATPGIYPLTTTVEGGGATSALTTVKDARIDPDPTPFGIIPGTFKAGAFDAAGNDYTQAGGHPYDATAEFELFKYWNATQASPEQVDNSKQTVVELPPGFVGNPTATPRCTQADFEAETCPHSSQVGVAFLQLQVAPQTRSAGIYNLVPEGNTPAQFGFRAPGAGATVKLTPKLRADGDYGINVTSSPINQADRPMHVEVTLWGVPADPSHDDQRCIKPNAFAERCIGIDNTGQPDARMVPHPSTAPIVPFLSNPTRCDGSTEDTTIHMDSWQAPGAFEPDGDPDLSDPRWDTSVASAPALTGCELLAFEPTMRLQPTETTANSPTGLEVELKVPQTNAPNTLATAHLKKTTVVLPEGMRVNPSAADGQDACTAAQIGLVSTAPIRFDKLEPNCSDAAKIGTVDVETPLLDDPLSGEVYLARQTDNPYGSLLAMYLVVRGPGLLVKLPGRIEADPQTGRLTTTVDNNPQVPFDVLNLRIKSGSRAPLVTPRDCGNYATQYELTSWAGHEVAATDTMTIDKGCGPRGFDPGVQAGTVNPIAGVFSPFAMQVTRNGVNQDELGRINVQMPKGLVAKLKDVGVCSEAQLAAGVGRAGRVAGHDPVCPLGSQIGLVTVGAGAGPTPFYPKLPSSSASGRVFLTDAYDETPYRLPGIPQAAYGLAIEVPAVAGPFDLGTVIVRAAIYVNPRTAEITVLSDKMPRILEGIPLDIRDIRVAIDRPSFTANPTSCAPQSVDVDVVSQGDVSAASRPRFQVGGCEALPFKPKLAMRLTGRKQVRTGKHPGIRAQVTQKGIGEAGIEKAEVRLPKSLALDPDNAQALCEFADGTKPDLENHCPKGSIVGRSRALSPFLNDPLVGNVYFVKNIRIDAKTGNEIRTLPMIVVALRGEIAINLVGTSSVDRRNRLVSTFESVPDAPVRRFNLNIRGGKSGIIAVTRTRRARINLCAGRHVAEADMDGHNGRRHDRDIRMKTPCTKKQTRNAKRAAKKAARKARSARS